MRRLLVLLLLGSLVSPGLYARDTSKTYMGRELADVMGPGGIDWLERDSRESEEKLTALVGALPLKPGMQVADLGAGSGVITRLMASRVLPGGMIHAVDIQQEMLDRLTQQNQKMGIKNVKTVLGSIKSPKLPPGTIDLVLMVDVYHEFSHPFEMMKSTSEALKKGGLVALVEYRGEDPKVPIKKKHKMTLAQIRKEMGRKELNLEFVRVDNSLPRQHLVFFKRR
ncbi:class I SAM-dependent methyltransferase [Oligoflexus tunisiensis]|uniref:class I SAM-dependent methyltransferase n=1 Tax=Oligoflexus tunisiensis TaxID=708132 RepID=UPI000A9E3EB1|nr:class I SAM-dependent methyltransferase [Oligoflexus tunisiensis]